MTAHELIEDPGRAYREGRLDRRVKVYLAPKLLVIDEMGYLPLDEMGATIFFQLVSARYVRGSIGVPGVRQQICDPFAVRRTLVSEREEPTREHRRVRYHSPDWKRERWTQRRLGVRFPGLL